MSMSSVRLCFGPYKPQTTPVTLHCTVTTHVKLTAKCAVPRCTYLTFKGRLSVHGLYTINDNALLTDIESLQPAKFL